MRITIFVGVLALAIGASGATLAFSAKPRSTAHVEGVGGAHPNFRPFGPAYYYENGVYVDIPPNCYVSREQRLQDGRLVWRPIRTCPSPGYR